MEVQAIKDLQLIKDDMIKHIGAINKHLTPEYLKNYHVRKLLSECHPTYRKMYENQIKKWEKQNQEE